MLKHFLLYSIIGIATTATAFANSRPALMFYTEDYPPFSYMGESQVTGLNTELLRAATTELTIDVQFMVVPWARAQAWTQRQDNACFFSAARTEERETMYQWAGPLSTEYITLFGIDPNLPVLDSVAEATQYRIAGLVSDYYSDWVEQQGLTIERNAATTNIFKLLGGRVDLWIAGSIGGPYIGLLENVILYPIAKSEESFELWLACNPNIDSNLIKSIDKVLERYRSSGFIDELMQGYR